MKYVYPAIFYAAKEGGYVVEFPDVQGAVTQGDTLYEAMEMAEDALAGMLVCYEDSKAGKLQPPMTNRVAEPTPLEKVVAEPDYIQRSPSSFRSKPIRIHTGRP